MTAADQLAFDYSLPIREGEIRQRAVVFIAQGGPQAGELTYQPETEHHTPEWLRWFATEYLPPAAEARLMTRTVTCGPWEAA
ncbi:hypothetical protein [Mycolicibacterium peregrinum]|uniref:hypothetical protein n=1 Tax=Mycolicibacterium peregrinum TaxID=43304 RepID=UPI003AAD71FB